MISVLIHNGVMIIGETDSTIPVLHKNVMWQNDEGVFETIYVEEATTLAFATERLSINDR